jgi:protocatechuate 3,4-dioxygenase beta subunit
MNRKVAAVVALLVVAAVAVWFFALRGKDGAKTPAKPTPVLTAGSNAGSGSAAKPQDGAPPMVGMAPKWKRDADKEGPLRLEGQVLDEHGDPVGGAVVTLSSIPPRTATSEADGGFHFDKLVGREYALTAIAGKRIGGPISHHLTATSDPAVLRLVAGAKLAVTVVDGGDKPVQKATVKTIGMIEQTATTGVDGIATLEPVHPGWVAVQASAEGYANGNGFTQVGGPGSTGQLKVILRNGYAVSGRVIDEKGKPIAGAQVATAASWDLPGTGHAAETDAKGAFTIKALPPGTHTLVASDGEHAPARASAITIESKGIDGIEIVMKAGGVLAGTVVDGARKPAPFAAVRVGGDGQQMWMIDGRMASTDKDGKFELRGLARTKLKVRAESDAAASPVVAVDLTDASDKLDLELVLDVGGTIAGTVVDEKGAPVAEVQVNAFPDILGGSPQDAMVLAGLSSASTDGGGRFTIRGLPAGEYRVRASRQSKGRYEWGQQGVQAKTGDTNVKITLAAPGSVTGKLVLEDGKPPSLANVSLNQQSMEAAKADGTFTLPDIAPGTYDLYVRGPGFTQFVKQSVVVEPQKPTDVGTLTLAKGRTVTGKVVDGTGAPVVGAKVKAGDIMYTLQGAEDQMETFEELSGMKTALSERDGTFKLFGIAKKAVNVLADHPRGRSNAVELPAGTDDPPPLTLTLIGFGQIVGKVTQAGKPLGGATVTAAPKGGGSQVQIAQSEADGNFTLKVAEGTVVLTAMLQKQESMSLKSASIEVQVSAGKLTKANIDIPVGSVTLTVSIKPLPNNKVDAAQVFLMKGIVAVRTAKEINEAFMGGKALGMKFWLGADKPLPEFDELVPGDYSVCSIPVTGDLNDPTFQTRLQQNLDVLAVHCKQAKITPSPNKQSFVQDLPAMPPLPQ